MTMKNIPLKELGWFSFESDMDDLEHLSIYQAIACLFRKDHTVIAIAFAYEHSISQLEIKSSKDVYDLYGVVTDQSSVNPGNNEVDYTHICIPESEIEEDLALLNYKRNAFTEETFGSFSPVYHKLLSEIEKYRSDEKTDLQIKAKNIGGHDEFYFNRKDIQNWNYFKTFKDLDLFNLHQKTKKRVREDILENHQKIIGMLMHLLATQSIPKKGRRVDFTIGPGNTKPNRDKIFSFFEDKFLVKDESEFPSKRTVAKYLTLAYKLFEDDVTVNNKT